MSKVLIVDDVPDLVKIAAQALRTDGHQVLAAGSGQQALELSVSQRPDVILLDVMMPGMDGIEVCRRLKADPQTRNIPVILVTAKTSNDDVVRGLNAGADDYVGKPYRQEILAARVRSALRAKQGHDAVCQINERLQTEIAQRKRMENELARAQRLESIGRLAAGIAHEINTPSQYLGDNLRFIEQGFADLAKLLEALYRLLAAAAQAELAPDLVAEIHDAARQSLEGLWRIAHIVSAVKAFSPANGEHKVLTDLNQAIHSTLVVCENQWKPVADVVTDLDPHLPLVPCAAGEFNEVILNLVLNAAQAIADAGRHLPMTVDGGEARGRIMIQTRNTAEGIEIRIQDSGTGIAEEIRGRVFEPFFTTREPGQGIGQGLAIAHAIVVQKHHGTITFESELGQGTTFTIRLPAGRRGCEG